MLSVNRVIRKTLKYGQFSKNHVCVCYKVLSFEKKKIWFSQSFWFLGGWVGFKNPFYHLKPTPNGPKHLLREKKNCDLSPLNNHPHGPQGQRPSIYSTILSTMKFSIKKVMIVCKYCKSGILTTLLPITHQSISDIALLHIRPNSKCYELSAKPK